MSDSLINFVWYFILKKAVVIKCDHRLPPNFSFSVWWKTLQHSPSPLFGRPPQAEKTGSFANFLGKHRALGIFYYFCALKPFAFRVLGCDGCCGTRFCCPDPSLSLCGIRGDILFWHSIRARLRAIFFLFWSAFPSQWNRCLFPAWVFFAPSCWSSRSSRRPRCADFWG